MNESRLLELIEYRMGKTHNNVALAREILAEVSRPESGSVGSVEALEKVRAELVKMVTFKADERNPLWFDVARAQRHQAERVLAILSAYIINANALLSTAHRGEVGTITASDHDQTVYLKGFRDGQYTQSKEAPPPAKEVSREDEIDYFVGGSSGKGLIRIEQKGHHIALILRGEESEAWAKKLVEAYNQSLHLSPAPGVAEAVGALEAGMANSVGSDLDKLAYLILCARRAISSLGVKS